MERSRRIGSSGTGISLSTAVSCDSNCIDTLLTDSDVAVLPDCHLYGVVTVNS
jgi:hypothetical protein